jgi:MFS family permease
MLHQGWVVLVACFFVMFGVWNAHAAFGVFLPILSQEFGWSRGAISVAASINLIVGGVIASFVGAASDRYGPRPVLALSSLIVGLSYFLVSMVNTLWQFYLALGVLIGVGMAGIYLVPTSTVSRWFEERRGLALGILLAGLNLSLLTGAPAAAFLIKSVGWRTAYLILGALVLTIAIPASLLTKSPPRAERSQRAVPHSLSEGATVKEAFKDRRLWLIGLAWLLLGFSTMMQAIHLVSYVKDRGVTLESASFALVILGVGVIIGRILFGVAADRVGTRPTFWFCQVVQIVALGWILTGPSLSVLYLTIFWLGLGGAGSDTTVVKGAVEIFGTRSIGGVMGLLSLCWRIGAALGPATAGFIYDATGSYALAFGLAVTGLVVSFLSFTLGTSSLRRSATALR